ncbi:MAG: glycosyltransferase family 4 protein [Melioribacteraceae bacterium]|nr:glycosyltransferase family 4 protein [Melioribacteraceae bacterium]MDD3557056.1 glycosyltransferase family 4 protein [Melioribacteraceae bacterium]
MASKKKILMLSQTVFPPDIRLEKEIRTLSQNGYDVTVICNQYNKGLSPEFEFCTIFRIVAVFQSKKLNKIINFPLFLNPRYLFKAIKIAIKIRPDFIHAHDLPMVPLGYILKILFDVPLIYDMHENYPDALREFKKKGILNFIFKNPTLARILDNLLIKVSDRIIVVVEENKKRLISFGVPEGKIFTVSNTVDLATFTKSLKLESLNDESENLILYTGTVSPERGLDTPVKAMSIVISDFPDSTLLIIGDGPAKQELNNLVVQFSLFGNVELKDWCGHENIGKYISEAKICIIPQPSNDFIDNTIPHKLFEYMSFAKPVLVADAKPLKRIVIETKCGEVFKSNDYKDCADKICKMLSSSDDYGKNGRLAVEAKYNWKNDAEILTKMYSVLK